MFFKRSMFTALLPLLFIGMLLAACGNTTTANGGGTPTATSAPAAAPVVKTASATVGGKSVTILTDTNGMTLYYYTPDTPTTATCTGGCATNWPPLVFSGSGTPTASSNLPGTLSAVNSADGNQVQYQGHFLYTFAGDKKAGDVNGQGKAGVWFAATTDLAAAASAAPVVKTASATVGGKSVTILTDANGMTLYYYTPDTATTATCTGGCATNWPPLVFKGSSTPTASSTLPGALTAVNSADGNQVQYQGHFLYTFIGDKKAGDTNGQGLAGGKWLVATTDLAALTSGYGY